MEIGMWISSAWSKMPYTPPIFSWHFAGMTFAPIDIWELLVCAGVIISTVTGICGLLLKFFLAITDR